MDQQLNDFFPSTNVDGLESRFNGQQDAIKSITGGAVASVVDFGTSAWNSLPYTDTVETQDVLSKISDNALNVYNEHPDTISTISFLGGVLIPSTASLKGMQMLRAGAKGASWFSEAGKISNMAKVETAFEDAGKASAAYRSARNAVLINGVANNLLDTAVAEVAIIGTMNAHPMMEDYMKDPVKNFGISMAFGGILGSGASVIADNFLINKATGGIASKAIDKVLNEAGVEAVHPAMPDIGKLQVIGNNIDSVEQLVKDQYYGESIYSKFADSYILEQKAKQKEILDRLLPDTSEFDKDTKAFLLDKLSNDTRMAGADSVKFYTSKAEDTNLYGTLDSTFNPIVGTTKVKGVETPTITDVVYHPEFDSFSTKSNAANFARANSLGVTEKTVNEAAKHSTIGVVADGDASLGLVSQKLSSAEIDNNYLTALKKVDNHDFKNGGEFVVAPDDMYTLNALSARMAKEPDVFANTKFVFTKSKPRYEAIADSVLAENKVSPDHLKQLKDLAAGDSQYNLVGSSTSLSSDARNFLGKWVGGSSTAKDEVRVAMDAVTRKKVFDANSKYMYEAYHSKESMALRKHLIDSGIADAEGNVYLYRGMDGKKVSDSPLESYTPIHKVAQSFGSNVDLYKVHVDDIVGTVTSSFNEYEYLVRAQARPAVAALPASGSTMARLVKSTTTINGTAKDVMSNLVKAKDATISSLLTQGYPFETIAIRTNTPIDTVKAYATSVKNGVSISDLVDTGMELNTYSRAADIPNYLNKSSRPLVVTSNPAKLEFTKLQASLDRRLGLNANTELMDVLATTSNSTIYKSFHDAFFGTALDSKGMKPALDMLRQGTSDFNNSKLGNIHLQSADQFLRNTGLGPIVTYIGKTIQNISTKASKSMIAPIIDKMAIVAKNPLHVIEFNTAMAVHASLSGWREFRNGQFVQKVVENGKTLLVPAKFNGLDYTVESKEVKELLETIGASGKEMYALANTKNAIIGRASMNDLGFWGPPFNPKDKFLAYVWDKSTNSTKLLHGKTATELEENVNLYKSTLPPNQTNIQVVTKQEQALWNDLNERFDGLTMQIANVEKFHSGASAPAIVKNTTDIFNDLISGYETHIDSKVKQLGSLLMHDTLDNLDTISSFNRKFTANQPLGEVNKALYNAEDGARAVKNILLGNNNLNANPFWKKSSENFETYTNWGLHKISDVMSAVAKPLGGLLSKDKTINSDVVNKLNYETIAKQLETEGIVNPWAAFDKEAAKAFGVASLEEHGNTSRKLVFASNSFAATFALKVLDVATPLVNMMSLPILTSLAKAQDHPAFFMSAQKGTAKVSTAQIMFEGARLSHSPEGKRLASIWEGQGILDSYVSEVNSVMRASRQFEKGAIPTIEKALDSKFIETLGKGAETAESIVRRQAMMTGAVLAKRLYPELDDVGVTIFARDFMDKSVGNYHASQRPVFFQGTMGVAMGLFQTYMLTMGQNLYRHLELKNYKAIGKAAMLQSGIFGAHSLPGFELVSNAIGDHYSDNNIDLTTGTFRAIDDSVANTMLYGLPSSLGPALYTRGDLTPRGVSPLESGGGFAAANLIKQTLAFGNNLVTSMGGDNPSVARAFGEAMSLQSVSRPLARVSELFTGNSITKSGNDVSTNADVYTSVGVFSRLLSTRPIEEAKLRDMMNSDTVYNRIDSDNRKAATEKLKQYVRGGMADDPQIPIIAEEYMRHGGSSRGWQASVNKAILESNMNGKEIMLNKLKPDNPLMYMIDSLDGQN